MTLVILNKNLGFQLRQLRLIVGNLHYDRGIVLIHENEVFVGLGTGLAKHESKVLIVFHQLLLLSKRVPLAGRDSGDGSESSRDTTDTGSLAPARRKPDRKHRIYSKNCGRSC